MVFKSPGILISREKHITSTGTYVLSGKYREKRAPGIYNALLSVRVKGYIMVMAPMGVSTVYKNISIPFKIKVEPVGGGGVPGLPRPPRWVIK